MHRDLFFKDDANFTFTNDNFFIAAALTNYDDNQTVTESAEYGELLIEHYGWGNNATGKDYGMSYSLQNHFCSDEELGYVQGPKTRAFPVYKHSQRELNNYRKKFKCIDEEDMKIWGDFNSAKAM